MRRYVFKLYPTMAQAAVLHEQRKMMADLWNALKQRHEDVYRRTRGQKGVCHGEGRTLTFFDMTNEITDLRHECAEWRAVPAITAHRVAKHLTDAYAAFYRRAKQGGPAGYPKWQARERSVSIPLGTMEKTGWRIEQREDNPFSWHLHYGSVSNVRDKSTWIHARGRIPARRSGTERRIDAGVNRPGGEPGDVHVRPTGESRRRGAACSFSVSDWRNADILWRDGEWWLSVCIEIAPRRQSGNFPIRIEFDLLDDFVRVNGIAETPDGLIRARIMQDGLDELKARRDLARRRGEEERELAQECAQLAAKIARVRKDALHVWTCNIIQRASSITIIAPKVREHTQTPRGDERSWGATVEAVSGLNRNTLSQAPAAAVQMLLYKAEEAGIRCDVVKDDAPKIAVGKELVRAGKLERRARRVMKKEAA